MRYFHLLYSCVFILFISNNICRGSSTSDRINVYTREGGVAELPCSVKPEIQPDRALLVLYYREGKDEPIFSFDARDGSYADGERWVDQSILGHRATFKIFPSFSTLVLDPVIAEDHGHFSCRVEYAISETSFAFFSLFVVIPPGVPTIKWNSRPVYDAVGPVEEHHPAEMTCTSIGGRPTPSVTWWKDGVKIGGKEELALAADGQVEVTTRIRITGDRNLAKKSLVCQSQVQPKGNITVQPKTTQVTLNITLPPLEVRITGGDKDVVEADSFLRLVCSSFGSHPPAKLTWWKNSEPISDVTRTMEGGGNVTTAAVILPVKSSDDGTVVSCRAENPALSSPPLSDSFTLSVNYKPIVSLMVRDDISLLQEGERTELECLVGAKPPVNLYQWTLNGSPLSRSSSLVTQANKLVITNIKPEYAGKYVCKATNLMGQTDSNSVHIRVLHSPKCSSKHKNSTIFIAKGESANLTCSVDAEPSDHLAYTWTKVMKDGTEQLLPYQKSNEGDGFSISVTSKEASNFDTIVCRASNRIGRQNVGCKFRLAPLGVPDPPGNCSSEAMPDSSSLTVSCSPGFDGGLTQRFSLLAWQSDVLVANVTSDSPQWLLESLTKEGHVTVHLTSGNSMGLSETVSLNVPNVASTKQLLNGHSVLHQQGGSTTTNSWLPVILGGLFGTLFILLIVLLVSVALIRTSKKKRIRRQTSNENTANGNCEDETQRIVTSQNGSIVKLQSMSSGISHIEMNSVTPTLSPSPICGVVPKVVPDPAFRNVIYNYPDSSGSPKCGCTPIALTPSHSKTGRISTLSDKCSDTESDMTFYGTGHSVEGNPHSSAHPESTFNPIQPGHAYEVSPGRTPVTELEAAKSNCSYSPELRSFSVNHCNCNHSVDTSNHFNMPGFKSSSTRSGLQEAEDSGLEDAGGSLENLSLQLCQQCHQNQPTTQEEAELLQKLSSGDLTAINILSLNRLLRYRLLNPIRNSTGDCSSNRSLPITNKRRKSLRVCHCKHGGVLQPQISNQFTDYTSAFSPARRNLRSNQCSFGVHSEVQESELSTPSPNLLSNNYENNDNVCGSSQDCEKLITDKYVSRPMENIKKTVKESAV